MNAPKELLKIFKLGPSHWATMVCFSLKEEFFIINNKVYGTKLQSDILESSNHQVTNLCDQKKKKVTNLQSQEVQKIYKDTASPTLTTQPRPKAKEHIFSPFLPEPTIDTNGFGGESLCSVHGDGLCPCVQCSCVQGWGLCRLDHHW